MSRSMISTVDSVERPVLPKKRLGERRPVGDGVIRLLLAGVLLGMSGCTSTSIPPLSDSDLDATRIAERWFEQNHGFSGLQAYEIRGLWDRLEFAVARR